MWGDISVCGELGGAGDLLIHNLHVFKVALAANVCYLSVSDHQFTYYSWNLKVLSGALVLSQPLLWPC